MVDRNRGPRFGVEEEFLVVDPVTRAIVPEAEAVVRLAAARLGDRVGGEITKVQVETRTDICETLDEANDQLLDGRRALAEAAAARGLAVIASGTPLLGEMAAPITEGARQDQGTAAFRGLHGELATCAVHVHVEMPERERALMVSNHLRPWLPALIALTGNSPYWAERDSGYASWRTLMWQRWPVGGPPPHFTSEAHFESLVELLTEGDALVDRGTIFWDIRPSAKHPTLEVRAPDVPMTAAESTLLAALVRALVATVLPAVDAGDRGPVVPPELMRVAYWRAARDGLSGGALDPRTGRTLSAADLVEQLLDTVRPALESWGELDFVTGGLELLLAGGTGAVRQRAAAADGGPAAAVDLLVAETVSGQGLSASRPDREIRLDRAQAGALESH
jgi:glutamate---cysteine ligase / carboxylate-amine ligase